ncbi:MAG: hypothetical protein R2698_07540 [Microthrixaceae bacterium]
MKGAVDRLVDRCSTVATSDASVPLDEGHRRQIDEWVDAAASEGRRMLAPSPVAP